MSLAACSHPRHVHMKLTFPFLHCEEREEDLGSNWTFTLLITAKNELGALTTCRQSPSEWICAR